MGDDVDGVGKLGKNIFLVKCRKKMINKDDENTCFLGFDTNEMSH